MTSAPLRQGGERWSDAELGEVAALAATSLPFEVVRTLATSAVAPTASAALLALHCAQSAVGPDVLPTLVQLAAASGKAADEAVVPLLLVLATLPTGARLPAMIALCDVMLLERADAAGPDTVSSARALARFQLAWRAVMAVAAWGGYGGAAALVAMPSSPAMVVPETKRGAGDPVALWQRWATRARDPALSQAWATLLPEAVATMVTRAIADAPRLVPVGDRPEAAALAPPAQFPAAVLSLLRRLLTLAAVPPPSALAAVAAADPSHGPRAVAAALVPVLAPLATILVAVDPAAWMVVARCVEL